MSEWGPCALGDYCLHRDTQGEWVQVEQTELGETLHTDCADSMLGAWLKLNHAVRALGRAIFKEVIAEWRSLLAVIAVVWVLVLAATIIGWWFV